MENSTVRRGLVVVVLITCTMLLLWWFVPRAGQNGGWHVTEVHAGDSIVVTKDGETHTVVLEGIVAANVGECGFEQSSENLGNAIGGQDVVLIPDSHAEAVNPDDPEQVWRRYVELDGVDVGLAQIQAGYATAQDGGFDRGGEYRDAAAKAANLDPAGCA